MHCNLKLKTISKLLILRRRETPTSIPSPRSEQRGWRCELRSLNRASGPSRWPMGGWSQGATDGRRHTGVIISFSFSLSSQHPSSSISLSLSLSLYFRACQGCRGGESCDWPLLAAAPPPPSLSFPSSPVCGVGAWVLRTPPHSRFCWRRELRPPLFVTFFFGFVLVPLAKSSSIWSC